MKHSGEIQFQIPAKTFILGEYAVLMGHDALILTTPPYFTVTLRRKDLNNQPADIPFHPESAAGNLLSKHMHIFEPFDLIISDPFKGMGGFGRSSAEFIAVWWAINYLKALKTNIQIKTIHRDYLNSLPVNSGSFQPSGVDLLSQCLGGGLVHMTRQTGYRGMVLKWPFPQMRMLLFHTQTHCPTSAHLNTLTTIPETLIKPLEQGIKAVYSSNQAAFIGAIKSFVCAQAHADLVTHATLVWIEQLTALPGVFAAKGCGALGADVILVCYEPEAESALIHTAIGLGLLPIAGYTEHVEGAQILKKYTRTKRQVI